MTDWIKTHRYRLAVAALLIATGMMYSNVLHGRPNTGRSTRRTFR